MKRTLAAAVTSTKAATAAVTAAALLAACGGGGGDPGGKTNVVNPPPAPTPQLAGYVGTWVADCAQHAQETNVISQASNGTITIDARTDYYSAADCTGFVIATRTQSSPVTATYTGTADVSVALPPSTVPTPIRVDIVSAAVSPYTLSVTGTGVTRTTSNGRPAWCINFAPGDATCIADEGTQPGSSSTGALYVSGNQLYELTPSGLSYVVTQRLTRR